MLVRDFGVLVRRALLILLSASAACIMLFAAVSPAFAAGGADTPQGVDGDRIPDTVEVAVCGTATATGLEDRDGDGIPDFAERLVCGTDTCLNSLEDEDGDGIGDWVEWSHVEAYRNFQLGRGIQMVRKCLSAPLIVLALLVLGGCAERDLQRNAVENDMVGVWEFEADAGSEHAARLAISADGTLTADSWPRNLMCTGAILPDPPKWAEASQIEDLDWENQISSLGSGS